MQDTWCVYRHISPSNKVYIGITSRKPELRWGHNGIYYKGCNKFYNAILKYGWDNIKHEILIDNASKEEACILEQMLISHYKRLGVSYNITDGGEGRIAKQPQEFCKEQSDRMKEAWRNNPEKYLNKRTTKGIRRSIEQIRKRSTSVLQFSIDGEFIQRYESVTEASNVVGISAKAIRNCCNGGYYCRNRDTYINVRQSGGFIWKWCNKEKGVGI